MPSDIVVYRARADPPAGTLERRTEHTHTTATALAAELWTLIEQVPATLWTTDTELRFTSSTGYPRDKPMFSRDELIGRAVAYSAGLINHFFRGKLDVFAPASGPYAVVDHSAGQGFTTIRATIRNATPGEALPAGTIRAIATSSASGAGRIVGSAAAWRCIRAKVLRSLSRSSESLEPAPSVPSATATPASRATG